jgi:hypothetical protein
LTILRNGCYPSEVLRIEVFDLRSRVGHGGFL